MIYSPATHCKNESLYKDKLLSKFDIPNLYCYASERASECERKMKENFLDTTKNWRIYGSRMESGDDQNTSALNPKFRSSALCRYLWKSLYRMFFLFSLSYWSCLLSDSLRNRFTSKNSKNIHRKTLHVLISKKILLENVLITKRFIRKRMKKDCVALRVFALNLNCEKFIFSFLEMLFWWLRFRMQ